MCSKIYDMVIIGGGPAGLTAGLYGARAGFDVLIIEQEDVGGQIASSSRVDNYPGFPESVGGGVLGRKMEAQAIQFGAEIVAGTVTGFVDDCGEKLAITQRGIYKGKTAIIAPGACAKTLGIPGEKELIGCGISLCAICDGPIYKDAVVVVVGGGDAAVEESLFLTRFANKVIIVHRRNQLRAVRDLQQKVQVNPKIVIRWDSVPVAFIGEEELEGVKIENVKTGTQDTIDCEGVFLYVGRKPSTSFLSGSGLRLDDLGYIITDNHLRTNLPGVFAAGDARKTLLRQVVTAAADGALAASEAAKLLG